ncbi:MAG: NACHT domain-containing protein [Ardenticatenaceae bacterium]|nr:NACHT domain-containing protein [Ardenticatenaceae bacterium]
MRNDINALRQFIGELYDLNELRTLCFELGIDYEDLPEGGKSSKVRDLLILMGRKRSLDQLLAKLHEDRPIPFDTAGLSIDLAFLDKLYSQLPSASGTKPRSREQLALIAKVETFWIEGVLENTLNSTIPIDLSKEYRPNLVHYPWEMVVQRPDVERNLLIPDKRIEDVFDEANQSLLIVGGPGSGKTTVLLELAQTLLARAKQNPDLPVPVVFNLSSWLSDKPVAEWLILELKEKYLIPKKIGRKWIERNKLLLLLDGLDEVKLQHQTACVKAINQFRQNQLVDIAICSRLEEYEAIPEKLKLETAIFLNPLNSQQIDKYLSTAGAELVTVRAALQEDTVLEELAQSPLMLSIMALAYEDITTETFSSFDSIEARRKHIFDMYVQQMFRRRTGVSDYSDEQTKYWLSYLAHQMNQQNYSLFLLEQLQPNWLMNSTGIWLYAFGPGLVESLVLVIASVIYALAIDIFRFNFSTLWFAGFFTLAIVTPAILGLLERWRLIRQNYLAETPPETSRKEAKAKEDQKYGMAFGGCALTISVFLFFFLTIIRITFFSPFENSEIFNFLREVNLSWLCFSPTLAILFFLFGRRIKRALSDSVKTYESITFTFSLDEIRKGFKNFIFMCCLLFLLMYLLFGGNYWSALQITLYVFVFMLTVIVLLEGLGSRNEPSKVRPNEGMRATAKNALLIGIMGGVLLGISALLLTKNIFPTLFYSGLILTLIYGGSDLIQHFILRLILWYQGYLPWRISFWDYAAERIFLRRVGGGYIFIHRMLQNYFAELLQFDDQVSA